MCTNTHYIYNRYIRKHILVNCGKCKACIQQKAQRTAQRIKNNMPLGYNCYFVGFSYENRFVPYVFLRDIAFCYTELPVYRDCQVRYVRKCGDYSVYKKVYPKYKLLTTVHVEYTKDMFVNAPLHELTKYRDKVGVCFYPDIQNFFKRLRINLDRSYGFKEKFYFFANSELGTKSQRPHFHSLIWFPQGYDEIFRAAIIKSWPFSNMRRFPKSIQYAINPSSYVASYVNKPSDFSSFLKNHDIKEKHSYSHGFGVAVPDFKLYKILEKADRGDMSYVRTINSPGGAKQFISPIPEYVINRYFPKFKGCTRLAPDSLELILLHPERASEFRKDLDYDDDDLHKINVSLTNSCARYIRYHSIYGLRPFKNVFDYARDYIRVWRCLKHTSNRLLHLTVTDVSQYGSFYENIHDFKYHAICVPNLESVRDSLVIVDHVDKQPWRVALTDYYSNLYDILLEKHSVNDIVRSSTDNVDGS